MSDVKNRPAAMRLSSAALGIAFAIADFSEAGHKLNVDQPINSGGKKKGVVRVSNDSGTYAMAIAEGSAPTSSWYIDSTEVTPAYTANYPAPTVGVGTDIKPNLNNIGDDDCYLGALPFPIVEAADLADLGNVVNYNEYSGKTEGSIVLVDNSGTLSYAIANAGLPDSPWTLSDGTLVTPTGTAIPSTNANGNEYKPTVLSVDCITCVDLPVEYVGDVKSLDYRAFYNDEQTVGSHDSKQIVVKIAGAYSVVHGIYDSGVLKWYDLGDTLSTITVASTLPATTTVASTLEATISEASGTAGDPAIGSVDTFCPAGTTVSVEVTGNSSGAQVIAFVTTKDLSVAEMAEAIALAGQELTDVVISSEGELVIFGVGGADISLTLGTFSLS